MVPMNKHCDTRIYTDSGGDGDLLRKALIEMQNATYKEMMSPSRPWNGSQKWWVMWAAHGLAHLNLPEPALRKRGRVETKAWGPGTKPCCGWLDDHIHNFSLNCAKKAPPHFEVTI